MKTYLAALAMQMALVSGVGAIDADDHLYLATQPDGTTFVVHARWDVRTADGYVFVYDGRDGWYYYAELDVRGEYVATPYKVAIDDPGELGIPKNLKPQRSAARQAEIDVGNILTFGTGMNLTQPDGTTFKAFWEHPLPFSYEFCTEGEEIPGDGYVIEIRSRILINYRDRHPFPDEPEEAFWAFVHDEESGWYYYAEYYEEGKKYGEGDYKGYYVDRKGYIRNAQGEYVASSYKVGIDDPPGYTPPAVTQPFAATQPPTAVQERSWGAVKNRFRK